MSYLLTSQEARAHAKSELDAYGITLTPREYGEVVRDFEHKCESEEWWNTRMAWAEYERDVCGVSRVHGNFVEYARCLVIQANRKAA